MNVTTTKALFLDALYQVLDNWVFRILCALVLLPVLATFLLGFEEEGVSLLFGWKHWSYESLQRAFGGPGDVEGMRVGLIEGLLQFVFQQYAGNIGVIFCIAATAFFVPRMIEKGAADVLFHKPLGRLSLYLSRYVAGLLFVGLLSAALVVGMYLGLRFVSGHDDPGILWAAPLLVYLFALIYTVSMLAGVVTRSTVAATLLTVMFFFFNGCVHLLWKAQELGSEVALGRAAEEEPEEKEEDRPPALLRVLQRTLVVAHYVLPKTGDADVLASKLRQATERKVFEEPDLGLRIVSLPEDYAPIARGQLEPAPAGLDVVLGEPRFQALRAGGGGRVELWRRERRTLETTRANGTVRQREERESDAVDALIEALRALPGTRAVGEATLPLDVREKTASSTTASSSSSEEDAAKPPSSWLGTVQVRAERDDGVQQALVARTGEHVYTLLHASSHAAPEQEFAQVLAGCVQLDPQSTDLYEVKLRLDAPWRFNPLFSVGSSVLFAVVMLLLGWAWLARIDF